MVRSEHASQCNHEPIWVWSGLIISKSPLMCATLMYGEKGEPSRGSISESRSCDFIWNLEIKVLQNGETSVGMHKWGDAL